MLPHADVLVPGGGRAQVDQLGLQGLVVIRGGVWVVVLVHIVLTTSSAVFVVVIVVEFEVALQYHHEVTSESQVTSLSYQASLDTSVYLCVLNE